MPVAIQLMPEPAEDNPVSGIHNLQQGDSLFTIPLNFQFIIWVDLVATLKER